MSKILYYLPNTVFHTPSLQLIYWDSSLWSSYDGRAVHRRARSHGFWTYFGFVLLLNPAMWWVDGSCSNTNQEGACSITRSWQWSLHIGWYLGQQTEETIAEQCKAPQDAHGICRCGAKDNDEMFWSRGRLLRRSDGPKSRVRHATDSSVRIIQILSKQLQMKWNIFHVRREISDNLTTRFLYKPYIQERYPNRCFQKPLRTPRFANSPSLSPTPAIESVPYP